MPIVRFLRYHERRMTTRRHHPRAVRLLPGLALFLIACAVLAAGLSAEPAAAVRYLAPSGSDANGGSLCLDPAAPCATLRHAVAQSAAGDAIHFAPGVYPTTGVTLPHALTLRGDGAAAVTLDGQSRGGVLTVAPGAAVVVEDLSIRRAAGQYGGAARVAPGGELTLRRVTLADNQADQGGAVYAAGARLTIEDSTLSGNSAALGGAVYLDAGTLGLARSAVTGNRAGAGAGLYVAHPAAAALQRATLSGNVAATAGGAIYAAGSLTLAHSLLAHNEAGSRGGGLFNDHAVVDIDYATFLDNAAPAGSALAGPGTTALRYSVLAGRALCAGAVQAGGNLAGETGCGQPAQPATALSADGRPAFGSNAIDGGPSGVCPTPGNAPPADLRGQPRPADGDGDGDARCDVGAFEFQPRLTVRHDPSVRDGTPFEYGGQLGPFSLGADGQMIYSVEAAPGSIRLEQYLEKGWKLTGLGCGGDSDGGSVVDLAARAVTVDLDPGETITCVFQSRPNRDTIGLSVRAPRGADPVVAFSGALGAFELRPATRPDMHSGRLTPGPYAVAALPTAGWRVSRITCAGDGDGGTTTDPALGSALIDLDAKEAIGCVFDLLPAGPTTLAIRHETTPGGDAPFIYTGDLGLFALRATSAGSRAFAPSPGVYRVRELLHPQWQLSRLSCAGDLDGGSVLLPEDHAAVIDLDPGEAITCTFSHARATSGAGAITIIQQAAPAGGTTFPFTGALGDFALTPPTAASRTFAPLPPGGYRVQQLLPAGWVLEAITCDGDADGGTTVLPDEATALIDLDEDEAVVCTFVGIRPAATGAITLLHDAEPADDTLFRYNGVLGGFSLRAPSRPSRSFVDLAPGSYSVGVRPEGLWSLYGVTCDGDTDGGSVVDLPGRSVTIDLDAGEAIVCRFHHLAPGVTPLPSPTPAPSPTPPAGSAARAYLPLVR
ncbi:MAG: hypothetical protein KA170_01770 [Candidatus Promineofilum sp.]|nr:hypothetical protein [Promineifilum sp.]